MLKLFNEVFKTNSPEEKIHLLLSYPYQEELKTVLRMATDPFLTYGITSVEGESKGNADIFRVLERLARRELTGGSARITLGEATLDEEDREIVTRILRKDLRCGLGPKLILKAYPGLIREFSVMRADKYAGLKPRLEYAIEPKYDGLRCIAIVENGGVTLLSRNGKEFTSSDHLKDPLKQLASRIGNCVFDGELTAGNFNATSSAVRRKEDQNGSTVYHIFDMLTLEEWRNPLKPHYLRRYDLENAFSNRKLPNLQMVPSHRISGGDDEVVKHYNVFRDMGYEGAIVKNLHGIYRFKRHTDWLKLKAVNDVDLKVESLVQGEGKYYGMLGAVIVKYKGKRVNVGSGWSDAERMEYWKDPNLIMGKTIEIQFHEETPDGALRHPRFIRIRDDK